MKQFLFTSSAGKILIAKALAVHPTVQNVLKNGTLVIIAGTTNGYLAEEILATIGETGFSRRYFFRGLTMPPNKPVTKEGRLEDESQFPSDVVIVKGKWHKNLTIADVADSLVEGDVIVKGANAIDLARKQAAVLVGHPKAGTAGLILPAVVGRRVKLFIAVGLEKRVNTDLSSLALRLNAPNMDGYRFLTLPGELFTELEALKLLCGVEADLFAAGGVCGAEGACWVYIEGKKEQEEKAKRIILSIVNEPEFTL